MRRLNILGKFYTVKVAETDHELHMGEYCYKTRTITISPHYARKLHTLGHELGHVLWEESGMSQLDEMQALEEVFCQLLGALIEDNIDILYEWSKRLKD